MWSRNRCSAFLGSLGRQPVPWMLRQRRWSSLHSNLETVPGVARYNAFRGQSSFGGFHGGLFLGGTDTGPPAYDFLLAARRRGCLLEEVMCAAVGALDADRIFLNPAGE
jgi:hypothetical protein